MDAACDLGLLEITVITGKIVEVKVTSSIV